MLCDCERMTVFLLHQSDAEGLPCHRLCTAELDPDGHLYASRLCCPTFQVHTSAMAVPQRQSPFATSADTGCYQRWWVLYQNESCNGARNRLLLASCGYLYMTKQYDGCCNLVLEPCCFQSHSKWCMQAAHTATIYAYSTCSHEHSLPCSGKPAVYFEYASQQSIKRKSLEQNYSV